ncbi:MAG: hypothetical protein DWI58_02230 [Chloroflexi bacterium]|nr:MAG: hypothetical protein DWI58_02230 [Chloroflexota bacterium]
MTNDDARIVALAITYHLGRPGSETDATTFRRHDRGLQSVGAALHPQLDAAQVSLDVTPYQIHRLDEALLGITNELKQYELSHRRSAVPGLEAAIAALFPALAPGQSEDDATALDLVTQVVLLRRRLANTVREAAATLEAEGAAAEEAARARRPWWRFWG